MEPDNAWIFVAVIWSLWLILILLFNYGAHRINNQPIKRIPEVLQGTTDDTVIF